MDLEEGQLTTALSAANIPTLLLALAHGTGDGSWLRQPFTPQPSRGLDDNDDGGLSPPVRAQIRAAAADALQACDHTHRLTAGPNALVQMMSAGLGETIPQAYGPLIEASFENASRRTGAPEGNLADQPPEVLIVGAGFGGIAAAVALRAWDIPFLLVDAADGEGGTWSANRYPGCGCDTPSHLYSFSFAPAAASWTRYYASQHEILRYLKTTVRDQGIHEHLRLGTRLDAAHWDEASCRWRVVLTSCGGEVEVLDVRALIAATGQFNPPRRPRLRGLRNHRGTVVHTAQWPESLDVSGRNVALIGTGASAMQVAPAVADAASSLTIYQRSPQWAMANPKYQDEVPHPVRDLMAYVPGYATWYRMRQLWLFGDRLLPALEIDPDWSTSGSVNAANASVRRFLTSHIEEQVGGRTDLLDKVVPRYPPFGKRMLMDNGWYQTLCRDDVSLVVDPIDHVAERAIVTAAGHYRPADVLVFATGFDTMDFGWSMDIVGRTGRSLRGHWSRTSPRAHLGITVPGYPNFFMLYGPNTNPAGGSVVFTLEAQVDYLVGLLLQMKERGIAAIDCRPSVHDEYNRHLDTALSRMVWSHAGVSNYFGDGNRIVTNSPYTNCDYWHLTREPDVDDYLLDREPRP